MSDPNANGQNQSGQQGQPEYGAYAPNQSGAQGNAGQQYGQNGQPGYGRMRPIRMATPMANTASRGSIQIPTEASTTGRTRMGRSRTGSHTPTPIPMRRGSRVASGPTWGGSSTRSS